MSTNRFRGFFCLTFIIMISINVLIFIPDIAFAQIELFLKANQAYEMGDFKTAASLYEQVINNGIYSGMLYYNLGNCYTKLGEIGEALVYYRKAERLMPTDVDLKFNLNYVLDQRKDKIETKQKITLARVFFFWYYWLNLKGLYYLFLAFNLIFWAVSLILLYKKKDSLNGIRLMTFCLFIIFLASFSIKVYEHRAIHHGVVVSKEVTVRSGNGTHHSPLFILHEGAEFRISEQTKGWMKIYLPDGKIGWIASGEVKVI